MKVLSKIFIPVLVVLSSLILLSLIVLGLEEILDWLLPLVNNISK